MKASMILSMALVGLLATGDDAGADDPPRRGPRPGNSPGRGSRPEDQPRHFPRLEPPPHRVLRPANRTPGLANRPLGPDSSPDSGPLPQGTAAVIPILRAAISTERGPHNEGNVYAPEVLFEGDRFRMWYGAQGKDGHDRIHLAVSQDGEKWTRRGVVVGNDEANHVNDPSVVRVGGTYFMFYTRAVVEVTDDIAMATSQDGVHWTKQGPVLKPGVAGEWDSLCVGRPSVLHEDDVFKMWYDGRKDLPLNAPGNVPRSATSTRSVGYATSQDGVHWTKRGPVHGLGAGGIDVKKVDGVYVMAYESAEGTQASVSTDGISWIPKGLWVPLSGRDFDRFGQVTPMMMVGPRGRLDTLFIGTATAASWDRNMIARVHLTPAQVAQVASPAAQASNP